MLSRIKSWLLLQTIRVLTPIHGWLKEQAYGEQLKHVQRGGVFAEELKGKKEKSNG